MAANGDGSGRPASQLAFLPGLTHYTIFNAPALASTMIPFLELPAPTAAIRPAGDDNDGCRIRPQHR